MRRSAQHLVKAAREMLLGVYLPVTLLVTGLGMVRVLVTVPTKVMVMVTVLWTAPLVNSIEPSRLRSDSLSRLGMDRTRSGQPN